MRMALSYWIFIFNKIYTFLKTILKHCFGFTLDFDFIRGVSIIVDEIYHLTVLARIGEFVWWLYLAAHNCKHPLLFRFHRTCADVMRLSLRCSRNWQSTVHWNDLQLVRRKSSLWPLQRYFSSSRSHCQREWAREDSYFSWGDNWQVLICIDFGMKWFKYD